MTTTPTEKPALNPVVLVTLGDGAAEGVPSTDFVALAAEDLLVLGVEGEVMEDEVTGDTGAKDTDSEVAIDVGLVAVGV